VGTAQQDFLQLQRFTKLVPFEWSHIVCTCSNKERQEAFNRGNRRGARIEVYEHDDIRRCNNCGKYPRYLLRRCAVCKDPFVKVFRHEMECNKDQRCWNCLTYWTGVKLCKLNGKHIYPCYTGPTIPPKPEDLEPRKPINPESITFDDISLDF